MVRWMSKSIKVLFVLLFISSLVIPVGKGEDQFNHIWTAESPIIRSNSWFGSYLVIDGEYIITSEPYADVDGFEGAGKIYVYDIEGNLVNTLQSPEPKTMNTFGFYIESTASFDVHEGLLIAYDGVAVDEVKDAGKIRVYDALDDLLFTIVPENPLITNYFGNAITIGDEIILISDLGKPLTPIGVGQVHLYNHEGELIKTIYSPEPHPYAVFGYEMEIGESQFYLAQLGTMSDDFPNVGPGYVYVYVHEGVLLNTLSSPEPEDEAHFGFAISVSGDKIAIREQEAHVDGFDNAGKVHIYNTEGTYLRTLLSPNPDTDAYFGFDLAILGDIIVVGEMGGNVVSDLREGKVYVFNIDGTLLQTLTAPEPTPRAAFGYAIDIQDDILVISEVWATVEGQTACGRIHVYKLGAPIVTGESVEEGTTVVSETVTPEPSGGIPGYPLWSVVAAILLVTLILSRKQNNRSFSLHRIR